MSYVNAYYKCDICGRDMRHKEDPNYRIEPRKTAYIRKYFFRDPFDCVWSKELDICCDCWEDMKLWIKEKEKENGHS